MSDSRDRARGALVGLAVGDALGTTLEFTQRDAKSISDMVGGGVFGLQAGGWTDDTAMALCLAASLVEAGFDPKDQMAKYCDWFRNGYMSHTGSCFDIGGTTARALTAFMDMSEPKESYVGSTSPSSAGNGSLMRLSPVAIYYQNDIAVAVEACGNSSRTTHGADECVSACRYFGALLTYAIRGCSKSEIIDLASEGLDLDGGEYSGKIHEISFGSFLSKTRDQIKSTGYVADTLEAAMWAFCNSSNFKDGALMAANLGGDADTVCAVYGQIAGAVYGESGIPDKWLKKLAWREFISGLAGQLVSDVEVSVQHSGDALQIGASQKP